MNARGQRFDLAGVLATPFVAGTMLLSLAAWFIAFIGQIVVEARFNQIAGDSTGSAVGVAWFGA